MFCSFVIVDEIEVSIPALKPWGEEKPMLNVTPLASELDPRISHDIVRAEHNILQVSKTHWSPTNWF